VREEGEGREGEIQLEKVQLPSQNQNHWQGECCEEESEHGAGCQQEKVLLLC
jgi:hypothetical protein